MHMAGRHAVRRVRSSANHPRQPKTIHGRKAPDGMYVPVMELGASCDKWAPTRFDSHKAQWLKEIGVMD